MPTILGELKRHFRDRTWTIHMSRAIQEAIARVEKATETLRQQLGRFPSAGEVAEHCGMNVEDVTEALLADDASRMPALDAPIAARGRATCRNMLGRDDDGARPRRGRALARAARRAS